MLNAQVQVVDEYAEPSYHPHPVAVSSYAKAIRIVQLALAWMYREPLQRTPATWRRAELHFVKWAQAEAMAATRNKLLLGQKLPRSHWLDKHNPVIDADGLIRVKARLHTAAYLSPDARCPIIVPPKHPLVELILLDLHARELLHNSGHKQLMATFQQRFHTVGLADVARQVCSQCVP